MFRLFSKNNDENKKQVTSEMVIRKDRPLPEHIAIIMDGNGRWAKERRLPRVAGHKEGMNTVKKITKAASNIGIKVLTLYAFSTENWKRPDDEVNFLMQLPIDFFDTFVPELIENNIQVQVMGEIEALPQKTQKAVYDAIEQTKENDGMILNFALNYGSRDEILQGVRHLAKQVKAGELDPESIDEEMISQSLMTGSLNRYQDPDLLIRTSGEQRISNFLLWQIAYSELYFTNVYWPDFDEVALAQAIHSFQMRKRRFGGLEEGE